MKDIRQYKFKLMLFSILIISGAIVAAVNLTNKSYDDRAKAEDLGLYCDNPPDCCAEIEKTGDPFGCDWPWRKYCRPSQCNIPEGVNRQRCGVAYKEVWPWGCVCKPAAGVTATPPAEPTIWDGFQSSCPVAVSPTAIPTVTSMPTAIPIPTDIPTSIPSEMPREVPTIPSYPTNDIQPTVYFPPTIDFSQPSPTIIPTPTAKPFNLPNILPPREKVMTFVEKWRTDLTNFFTTILP